MGAQTKEHLARQEVERMENLLIKRQQRVEDAKRKLGQARKRYEEVKNDKS